MRWPHAPPVAFERDGKVFHKILPPGIGFCTLVANDARHLFGVILAAAKTVVHLNSAARKGTTYVRQTRRSEPLAASRVARTSGVKNSRPPGLRRHRRYAAGDSNLVSLERSRVCAGYATQ